MQNMDILADDVIILTLSTYLDPHELLNLALSCKRFGGKPPNDDEIETRDAKVASTRDSNSCKKRKHHSRRVPHGPIQWLGLSSARQKQEQHEWSLAEEAARRIVKAAFKGDLRWLNSDLHNEKKVNFVGSMVGAFRTKQSLRDLDVRDSWMAVYHRLYKFQTQLVFYRLVGDSRAGYVNRDPCHIQSNETFSYESSVQERSMWAVCQEIMTQGKHYVEFEATREGIINAGIVRPIDGWEDSEDILSFLNSNYEYDESLRSYLKYCRVQQRKKSPGFQGNTHNFFLNYYGASRVPCKVGDVVGMLLDLDKGHLMAFRNGVLLRAARAQNRRDDGALISNLSGHYCWALSITWSNDEYGKSGVLVKRLPVPSSLQRETAPSIRGSDPLAELEAAQDAQLTRWIGERVGMDLNAMFREVEENMEAVEQHNQQAELLRRQR